MVEQTIKFLIMRLVIVGISAVALFEYNHQRVYTYEIDGLMSDVLFSYMRWAEFKYLPFRTYLLAPNTYVWIPNIYVYALLALGLGIGLFFLFRKILTEYQKIRSKILGLDFNKLKFDFKFESFRPEIYFLKKPKGSIFLGLTKQKEPFYLESLQRSTHIQIIGRTGSGKSKLLETMMLQDIQEGNGVIFLDGKGDLETKEKFCGMAAAACRREDLHVFDLASLKDSWIYNPVYMRPDRDPIVIAQKMLSTFPCDTEFYRHIQENLFTLMLQIAHAQGKRVTLKDLHFAIRRKENLLEFAKYCPNENLITELQDFLHVNGNEYLRNVIGIEAWLRKFSVIEQINRNNGAPEIDFEEVFNKGKLIYFRLPSGYHQSFSKDIGHLILQDLQFMAGLRQVEGNQSIKPFNVYVDEFAVFADETFIQAINKARSANIRWTIAHQSYSDLEAISTPFSEGVWDNLRTKIVLSQRNAELCEKISSELGTFQRIERTERIAQDLFFTRKSMGDASTKLVDEFVLHPNFLKNLHPYGQAYVVGEKIKENDSFVGLNFGQVQCERISINPSNLTTVKTIGGMR